MGKLENLAASLSVNFKISEKRRKKRNYAGQGYTEYREHLWYFVNVSTNLMANESSIYFSWKMEVVVATIY